MRGVLTQCSNPIFSKANEGKYSERYDYLASTPPPTWLRMVQDVRRSPKEQWCDKCSLNTLGERQTGISTSIQM